MNQVKLRALEHFDHSFDFPRYETIGAAGADIRASLPSDLRGEGLSIKAGQRVLVPTGLAMEIPHGFEIQVRPRSGLSFKTNLLVVNSPGTIDCDYRGEVKVILGNFGLEDYTVNHGDRVAQLVLSPVIQAEFVPEQELSQTERGTGGFGSTGKN